MVKEISWGIKIFGIDVRLGIRNLKEIRTELSSILLRLNFVLETDKIEINKI